MVQYLLIAVYSVVCIAGFCYLIYCEDVRDSDVETSNWIARFAGVWWYVNPADGHKFSKVDVWADPVFLYTRAPGGYWPTMPDAEDVRWEPIDGNFFTRGPRQLGRWRFMPWSK